MNVVLEGYKPLLMYTSPASIPQIVAHIQDYLIKNPIVSIETIAQIIVQALQEHPELLNGSVIPISEDSEQSIKAYIDSLPLVDGYTKAEINLLLTGKQDTLTFDQTPTPGSSNPVTSSGIIAAMSALQSSLETMINQKADAATTYTKNQVDTKLLDKANVADIYSKNTMDAKLLEINTDITGIEDDIDGIQTELNTQSQQIADLGPYNGLDSTSTTAALSAAQGKVLGNSIAYVENGNNATQKTYAEGEYIVWKGSLYTVNSDGIPLNTAIAGHVTAVSGGGLNSLNNKITHFTDVVITVGDTLYNGYYYGDGDIPVSIPRIRAFSIISVTNNIPAFCMRILSGKIRAYTVEASVTVTVRILYV